MILNSNGFDAIAAYSEKAGVDAAQRVAFDFLISDVVMQEMNGIEAANEICGLLPDCKVVLISGNNDTAALLKDAESRYAMTARSRQEPPSRRISTTQR
jgi:DNA-binding NarL/FixJ family response regulator